MGLRWNSLAVAAIALVCAMTAAAGTASAQDQPKAAAEKTATPATAAPDAVAPAKRVPSKAVAAAVRNTMASPVRAKCAGLAQTETDRKAITHTPIFFRPSAGGILGAVIGTVIVTAIEHERRKGIYSEAETKCLAAAGLVPMGQLPAAKGEGRVRNASTGASTGSSGNTSKCACREMKSCTGSWLNMSCNQLKATCRNARTNTIVWMKNSCEKLETLVGAL